MTIGNKVVSVFTPSPLALREAGDGAPGRTVTGTAIVFNTESQPLYEDNREVIVEVISPTAVPRALLDQCDIKMTMFHDRTLILARSVNGEGTLSYNVDERGVHFEFEAPHTVDGDKAVELVRRGDLAGCSFAFRANYGDPDCVDVAQTHLPDGRIKTTFTVKRIDSVHDFTLAGDPAYAATDVDVRALRPDFDAAAAQRRARLAHLRTLAAY